MVKMDEMLEIVKMVEIVNDNFIHFNHFDDDWMISTGYIAWLD